MRVLSSRPARLAGLVLVGAAAAGCNPEPIDCPVGCQVFINPESVTVGTSPAFWAIDNVGMSFFVDVLVLDDSNDGLPMNNVKVYVQAPNAGVGILPRTAVETVSPASLPDNWESIKQNECLDENGQLVLANELCAYYYDQDANRFYDLSGSVKDTYPDTGAAPGSYLPDYLEGVTDDGGKLRTWIYLDALPTDQGGEGDVSQGGIEINFSIGVHSTRLTVDSSN